MTDDSILIHNLEIGIINELEKKGLISKEESKKAIEILKAKEVKKDVKNDYQKAY